MRFLAGLLQRRGLFKYEVEKLVEIILLSWHDIELI